MKITVLLKKAAERCAPLRILMRILRTALLKLRYRLRGLGVRTDEGLVVLSAYNGKSYACSPKAMYEYLCSEPRFDGLRFVWLFDKPEDYAFLENGRTRVMKNRGALCEKTLAAAKYWIFNFRAQDQWLPRRDQVYVQCWHGTPLKRLGYDIVSSDNAMNSVPEIRSKYRTDAKRFSYLTSSCPFVTEKFATAWATDRFGRARIVETGYPRNDFLSRCTEADLLRVRERLGLSGTDKTVILYAPTWRDNQHDAELGYVQELPVDFDLLRRELGEDCVILFRAHYLVADSFDFDTYGGFIRDVSGWDDINELYVAADMLITDYSSVFFDYAILNRPMLFYMYDLEQYRDELRGFYLELSELPGPIVTTEAELVSAVRSAGAPELRAFNEKYNGLHDGNASARLAETVFGR